VKINDQLRFPLELEMRKYTKDYFDEIDAKNTPNPGEAINDDVLINFQNNYNIHK